MKIIYKIFLENECVNSCPDGYELINELVYGHQVSYCHKCKNNNTYFYNKTCYDNAL